MNKDQFITYKQHFAVQASVTTAVHHLQSFQGGILMPNYEVAHIKEQGVDLIIVPLQSSFGHKPKNVQLETQSYIQGCASSAGLAGTVVLVWEKSGGRMGFLAPQNWHSFFKSISLQFVAANINRKLTCT